MNSQEEDTIEASINLYEHAVMVAAQGLDNLTCYTEFIDNGFDAGATMVRLNVRNRAEVRIADNGAGVPNLENLVRFGGHLAQKTTRSGKYGTGFKDGALCVGGVESSVSVITTYGGEVWDCTIEWPRLKTGAKCMRRVRGDADVAAGTTITIRPMRLRFPDGERLKKFVAELGYIYSPALKDGGSIEITSDKKTTKVERWRLPEFAESVQAEICINGKRAKLLAGIVKDGVLNDHPGITYSHGFRVIKRSSRAGCGTWSHNRICGYVHLDSKRSWARTKNKSDLVDADDLYEEVERHLAPLLSKAATSAHALAFAGNISMLNAMVTAAVVGDPTLKAKRGKGNKTGTQRPTGEGSKHRRARETQPGSTFGGRRVQSISIDFRTGWEHDLPIGEWDTGTRGNGLVTLYRDHPAIAAALSPWNSQALALAATSVLAASHGAESSSQGSMVMSHDVLRKLAEFSAGCIGLDGESFRAPEKDAPANDRDGKAS